MDIDFEIVIFVPLGLLLPIVFDIKSKLKVTFLSLFIVSLICEVIQLPTAVGDFDVDDILLNVTGLICGYIFYPILTRLIFRLGIKNYR